MRKLLRLGTVIVGIGGLSIAGVAAAHANWTVHSTALVMEVKTVTMPAFYNAPTVQLRGREVTISWMPSARGIKAERYIVVRHGPSSKGTEVCDTVADTCRDTAVPDGTWTYIVRSVYASWRGPDSPASVPIKIGTTATSPETPSVTTGLAAEAAPEPPVATTMPTAATTSPTPREPDPSDGDQPALAPTVPSTPDVTATSESAAPADGTASTAAN